MAQVLECITQASRIAQMLSDALGAHLAERISQRSKIVCLPRNRSAVTRSDFVAVYRVQINMQIGMKQCITISIKLKLHETYNAILTNYDFESFFDGE